MLKQPVVCLHGIYDSGSSFDFLAGHLMAAGHPVFAPDCPYTRGKTPLVEVAYWYREAIEQEFGREPVHLLGFSLGGLLGRCLAARVCEPAHVLSLTTISAPHHGSRWATLFGRFLHGAGYRDLAPGSNFLADLAARDARLEPLPVLSVWTPLDLMVVPSRSSVWGAADNVVCWSLGHALMLRSRRVAGRVVEFLTAVDPAPQSPPIVQQTA